MNIHIIIKLAFAIKRDFNKQLEKYGLTFNQWLILKELNMNGNISAKELAIKINTDKATLSQCLANLEKKNYINRVNSKDDARVKLIEITPLAKEMCAGVKEIERDFNQKLNKIASESEIKTYNELSCALLMHLEGE